MIENPNVKFPLKGLKLKKSVVESLTYIKPTIKNKKKIIVGDFSYYSGNDFEKQVTNFYPWYDEKLIIGKFCSIAVGVEFIMNGANHHIDWTTTYPFNLFKGWKHVPWSKQNIFIKGDTVIGNDVWIGEYAVILPNVKIGDGAIIGAHAVVGSDVPPYSIAVGNPARVIRKRFSDKVINHLLKIKWWNWPQEKIKKNIDVLLNNDEKQMLKLK